MAMLRSIVIAALVGLSFLAFAAPPAAAIDPDVGCGGNVVEACFPVCVTDPCPGYVCIHTSAGSVCRVLYP